MIASRVHGNKVKWLHVLTPRTVSPCHMDLAVAIAGPIRPVRIAHDQGFPPFAEVKDGKSEGLAVHILRAASTRAGVKVNFVPVSSDQRSAQLMPLILVKG